MFFTTLKRLFFAVITTLSAWFVGMHNTFAEPPRMLSPNDQQDMARSLVTPPPIRGLQQLPPTRAETPGWPEPLSQDPAANPGACPQLVMAQLRELQAAVSSATGAGKCQNADQIGFILEPYVDTIEEILYAVGYEWDLEEVDDPKFVPKKKVKLTGPHSEDSPLGTGSAPEPLSRSPVDVMDG